MGFLTAGASAGGIIFPIMLQRLIPRVGFGIQIQTRHHLRKADARSIGWSIRICAFIVLFCYIIAVLTIKPRRPTKPLPPLYKLLDFSAFRDPCYIFLALGAWFSIFSIFNPFFYVGLYGAVAHGASSITPFYLAIMCATSIAGRVGPGLIADRVGR